MKSKFYFLTLLLIPLLVACGGGNKFSVNGTLTGSYANEFNGKKATVAIYQNGKQTDLAEVSATIDNNTFTLTGEAPKGSIAYVLIEGATNEKFMFVPEKENLDMEIGDKGVQLSGSVMNNAYQNFVNSILSNHVNTEKLLRTLHKLVTSNNITPERFTSLETDMNHIDRNIESSVVKYVQENIEHPIAEYALATFSNSVNPEQVKELIASFPNAATSDILNELTQETENRLNTAKGKQYIDINGADAKDKEVKLSDFVGKGEITIVHIGYTADEKTKDILPIFTSLEKSYAKKGLNIVSVFLDQDKNDAVNFSNFRKLNWQVMFPADVAQTLKAYNIETTPYFLLLDNKGTILEKGNINELILEYKAKAILDKAK